MPQALQLETGHLRLPARLPPAAQALAAALAAGDSVTAAFTLALRPFAFTSFTYAVSPVPQPSPTTHIQCWTNAPAAWVAEYNARNYLAIDPRVRLPAQHMAPVLWDHTSFAATPEHQRFLTAAARYDIGSGVLIRMYDPQRAWAALSFNLAQPELDAGTRHRLTTGLPELLELAQLAHGHIVQPLLQRQQPLQRVRLSPRERQCLQLAARGATANHIGNQLHIGLRTVHYHMGNLLRKLDAANQVEAVARAITEGLIDR